MGKEGSSSSGARLVLILSLLPVQSRIYSNSRVVTSLGLRPRSTLFVSRMSSLSGGLLSGFPAKAQGSCHSHLGAERTVQLLPASFLFVLKDTGQSGSLPASLFSFPP